MGTNFYMHEEPPCPTCHRSKEMRHIGKSSAGWCFTLRVYPREGINTLEDWKKLWAGKTFEDEYGDSVSEEQLLDRITNRHAGVQRHTIDGSHCIGHGEGTWDYMVGEFC